MDGPKSAGEVASPPPAVDAIGDGKEMDDSTYDDEAEGEDKAGDATRRRRKEDEEEEEEEDEDDEEEDQEEEDDEEEGEDEEDVAANDGQQNDVANCIGEHCSDAMNEQMYRIVEDVALKAGLDIELKCSGCGE